MHILRIMLLATALAWAPSAAGGYELEPAPTPTVATRANGGAVAQREAGRSQEAASTAPVDGAGRVVTDSVGILIRLFVLAVILESALTVVFRWRPYLALFDGKAVNPPVTFAAALALVLAFDLDQVGVLIGSYSTASGGPAPAVHDLGSAVLTALVIAGGSAGVNKMLRALGYRSNPVVEDLPKPARTEAWIAVLDTSRVRRGTFHVAMRRDTGDWTVLGSITSGGRQTPRFGWALRNRGRFPPSGGYPVPIDTPIEIGVMGTAPGEVPVAIWGPNALAAGAIVDVATSGVEAA